MGPWALKVVQGVLQLAQLTILLRVVQRVLWVVSTLLIIENDTKGDGICTMGNTSGTMGTTGSTTIIVRIIVSITSDSTCDSLSILQGNFYVINFWPYFLVSDDNIISSWIKTLS